MYNCTPPKMDGWNLKISLWKGKSSSIHFYFSGFKMWVFRGCTFNPKVLPPGFDMVGWFDSESKKNLQDWWRFEKICRWNAFLPQHGFSQQPNSPDISNTPTAKVSWYKPTPHPTDAQVFPDSALPAEQPGGGFSHERNDWVVLCITGELYVIYTYIYIYIIAGNHS